VRTLEREVNRGLERGVLERRVDEVVVELMRQVDADAWLLTRLEQIMERLNVTTS
jgi:hypothetical protein